MPVHLSPKTLNLHCRNGSWVLTHPYPLSLSPSLSLSHSLHIRLVFFLTAFFYLALGLNSHSRKTIIWERESSDMPPLEEGLSFTTPLHETL